MMIMPPAPKSRATARSSMATQISNVEISGTGTIDGMAAPIYAEMDRILAINRDDPAADRRARFGLMLSRCSNVRVRDITIRDTPMFLMAVRQCDNVCARRLHARRASGQPQHRRVADHRFQRCARGPTAAFRSATMASRPRRKGQKPIERLIVDNCVIRSDDGAIKLGTQSRGVLRDSLFNNIAIVDSRYGIAAFMIRGGLYANNRFTNIRIATGGRHSRTYPISSISTTANAMRPAAGWAGSTGWCSTIWISPPAAIC